MGTQEGRPYDLQHAEGGGVALVRRESPGTSSRAAQCVFASQRRRGPLDLRTKCRRRTDVSEQRWPAPALAAAGLLFILLATASSAGYRFGVSDQAFSVPSVIHALTPGAFPRDSAMIDTQARFM